MNFHFPSDTISAEIISVGTELLLGDIVNTDTAYLARELAALGIPCYYQSVVGDNPARLTSVLSLALSRSNLILLTGGLGPTCDDLTKETAAALMGKTLSLHMHSYERIRAVLSKRGLTETDNQKKQAMLPPDAVVFDNDYGTAPAFAMEDAAHGKLMILMPGPPRELEPLFAERVRPYLARITADDNSGRGSVIYSLNIGLYGIGEAAVEALLRDKMESGQNPTIAPYCNEGEVRLRITARGDTEEHCHALCLSAAEEIRSVSCAPYRPGVLDDYIYGIGCNSLEEALVTVLREKKLHISCAESCTGGYIAKRITNIPGASEVLDGAFVTYAEKTKMAFAAVKPETLAECSVYSSEVAAEMAQGCLSAVGADIGIGVTGIAGVDGDTRIYHGKEEVLNAGTVFLASASTKWADAGSDGSAVSDGSADAGSHCETVCLELAPGKRSPMEAREYIRHRASSHALWMALQTARRM
ncbi:MAG: competence/damage-inducible protein A [Clostridia bacterium]|nr:competence/damage-inducible protein A [Clostridia bacterium]